MSTENSNLNPELAHLESLKDSVCLVTGGAGFIGSQLTDALLAQQASVRILDNFSTGFQHNLDHLVDNPSVKLIRGDVADAKTAAKAVAGVDFIFHHAAMASVPRSMREPALCHDWCATSTVNLLAAAANQGVKRLVLASTSAAYGDSPFVSKRESDPTSPLSPYAAAKLAAESYCRSFSHGFEFETVILRYFNVFGPRQDPQSEYSAVIPKFVSMILSGERPIIYGDGHQSRDFIFVNDVAKANLLAAVTPGIAGETFNIGRGQSISLLELLSTLRELLGQDIQPIHEPARAGDVRDSLADTNQARRKMNFAPEVTIAEGLRRSIEYYHSIV